MQIDFLPLHINVSNNLLVWWLKFMSKTKNFLNLDLFLLFFNPIELSSRDNDYQNDKKLKSF